MRTTPRSLAALALAATGAHAQFVEPEATAIHTMSANTGSFGWAVSELADVDGDGLTDVIVGQPNGGQQRGFARIHSSATGERLYLTAGNNFGDQLGYAIADAGDVNNDGTPDIIAGAPFGGYCRLASGVDGAAILDIPAPDGVASQFGYAVSSLGDVDGDGRSDLLIGAPGYNNGINTGAGRVYVCSGADGSVIHTIDGPGNFGAVFGQGVSGIGDVDGDGITDGAVSAPGQRRAYIYSGATGLQIGPDLVPGGSSTSFGQFFVGGVGDLTGDGVPDVYVGDYAASRAYVFSGADGSIHLNIAGGTGSGLGCGRGLYADADGDGVDDLCIGAYTDSTGGGSAGQVRLYSGADGSLIRVVSSNTGGTQLGFDAVGIGDVNGDGAPDFVGAASPANTVHIIAGLPLPCEPDVNDDGILDNGDIGAFVTLFLAGDPSADFNDDGILDNGDIGAFVAAFLAGC
ncbi:MAG: FG-GAP-like repeat-containing protein [Phycisphaerales bacterium JB040]